MYYYTITIMVFGFAKNIADDKDSLNSEFHRFAADTCLQSARQIAKLVDIHRSSWGLDLFVVTYIQWITVLLFTLLEDLNDPMNREAFASLSVAAKVASRRWVLGKGMLRAVQVTARKMEVSLPSETDVLFSDFEKQSWGPKDRRELSSSYPNFAVSIGSFQTDEVELDKFLEKWDTLDISDSGEVDKSRSPAE